MSKIKWAICSVLLFGYAMLPGCKEEDYVILVKGVREPQQVITFAIKDVAVQKIVSEGTFEWTFEDGGTATGNPADHTFNNPGVFRFTAEFTLPGEEFTRTVKSQITIGLGGTFIGQIVYQCDDGDIDICLVNADFTGIRQNLSNIIGGDSGIDGQPQWSPNNSQIAYLCEDGDYDICVINSDGTGSRLNLSDSVGGDMGTDISPQWSPDGRKIVYVCVNVDQDICIVNADGSGTRLNLSSAIGGNAGVDGWPQWSPDGSKIAYVCVGTGFDICIANSDGSGSRLSLAQTLPLLLLSNPQWSPDGSQIAYVCQYGDFDICIVNANGSGSPVNLSDLVGGDDSKDITPQWSPDGSKIAYVCDDGPEPDVCVVNSDGTGSRINLGYDQTNPDYALSIFHTSADPQWSPDGTQIAYRCFETDIYRRYGKNDNICIVNVVNGTGHIVNLGNVFSDTGNDATPQWSY